jgi:hypothetical protein
VVEKLLALDEVQVLEIKQGLPLPPATSWPGVLLLEPPSRLIFISLFFVHLLDLSRLGGAPPSPLRQTFDIFYFYFYIFSPLIFRRAGWRLDLLLLCCLARG